MPTMYSDEIYDKCDQLVNGGGWNTHIELEALATPMGITREHLQWFITEKGRRKFQKGVDDFDNNKEVIKQRLTEISLTELLWLKDQCEHDIKPKQELIAIEIQNRKQNLLYGNRS